MDVKYYSYSYSYLLMAVHRARRRLEEPSRCHFSDCLTALIFSALAFEAFANHIGQNVLEDWSSLKRKLSPYEKIKKIAKARNTKIDWNAKPYKSIPEIIKFRNAVAHAETTLVSIETLSKDKVDDEHWPSKCRKEIVDQLCPDIEEVISSFPKIIDLDMPKERILAEPIPYRTK